jgi:hypothetical protein
MLNVCAPTRGLLTRSILCGIATMGLVTFGGNRKTISPDRGLVIIEG